MSIHFFFLSHLTGKQGTHTIQVVIINIIIYM